MIKANIHNSTHCIHGICHLELRKCYVKTEIRHSLLCRFFNTNYSTRIVIDNTTKEKTTKDNTKDSTKHNTTKDSTTNDKTMDNITKDTQQRTGQHNK